MDIILIPGLWLDGSSWAAVVPALEQAGHHAHPLTLPGMGPADRDRGGVGLQDCVDAVVAVVDASPFPVMLVGHSAGCGIGHAVVDARPDKVAAAVYVAGFPTGTGRPVASGFAVVAGRIPLPEWSAFDDGDLAGLDADLRRDFRRRAIPSPGRLATDLQHLRDERRYTVPVTVVATEFTSDMLRGWMEQDLEAVRELAMIHDVVSRDLPTGHWPQFTRPDDLAALILDVAAGAAGGDSPA